jgi:hypothetical protein
MQHALFCERQYALIYLEQVWEENRFTAEGEVLHERVHSEHYESRKTYRNVTLDDVLRKKVVDLLEKKGRV